MHMSQKCRKLELKMHQINDILSFEIARPEGIEPSTCQHQTDKAKHSKGLDFSRCAETSIDYSDVANYVANYAGHAIWHAGLIVNQPLTGE